MLTFLKVLEVSKGIQQSADSENLCYEDGQSSESVSNGSSSGPSQDNDESSDTYLKLGYVQMHFNSYLYFVLKIFFLVIMEV